MWISFNPGSQNRPRGFLSDRVRHCNLPLDYGVKPRWDVQNSCGALVEFCVSGFNAVKLTSQNKSSKLKNPLIIPRLLFLLWMKFAPVLTAHTQPCAWPDFCGGWFKLMLLQLQGTCKNVQEMVPVERTVPCSWLYADHREEAGDSGGRRNQERAL